MQNTSLAKIKTTKIKSSTLVYAVFVMLIISLICSSLIMVSYYQNIILESFIEKDRVYSNVTSGINLLLANNESIEQDRIIKMSLFDSYNDSIELSLKQWGLFDLIYCKSWWKNFTRKKIALAGNFYKNDNNYAIHLTDMGKPLSLCGNTIITGDCYLPKAGVEKAYIEGKNFKGKQLIDGQKKLSKDRILKIHKKYSALNQEYFQNSFYTNELTNKYMIGDVAGDSLSNSFFNPTITVYAHNHTLLQHTYLKGNIIILCDSSLVISNTCNIDDIVVCAPSIRIDNEFQGQLQLFVKDTLFIGRGAELEYPSVIGLVNHNPGGRTIPSIVFMEEYASFSGVIYSSCKSEVITRLPILRIEKGVTVTGQVFWDGITELKGNIYGSVTCKKFMLKTPSSIYDNHLLDVTIDITKLPEYFTGISLNNNKNPRKIIKWLQ